MFINRILAEIFISNRVFSYIELRNNKKFIMKDLRNEFVRSPYYVLPFFKEKININLPKQPLLHIKEITDMIQSTPIILVLSIKLFLFKTKIGK